MEALDNTLVSIERRVEQYTTNKQVRIVLNLLLNKVGENWNRYLKFPRENTLDEKWSYFACNGRMKNLDNEIDQVIKSFATTMNSSYFDALAVDYKVELRNILKSFKEGFTIERLRRLGINETDIKLGKKSWTIITEEGLINYTYGDENDLYFQLNIDAYMIIGISPIKINRMVFIDSKVPIPPKASYGRLSHIIIHHFDKLCRKNGHACYPIEKIEKLYMQNGINFIDITVKNYMEEIYGCKFRNGYFYIMYQAQVEDCFFEALSRKRNTIPYNLPVTYEGLDDVQSAAVNMFLSNPVSLLTGGPGCGKTKTIIRIVNELVNAKKCYFVLAPTGKAVGNIRKEGIQNVMTCHKFQVLINFDVNFRSWRGSLIFEECSMLSDAIVASILKKVKYENIMFVGDPDQLPPIDWGIFFSEAIRSKYIPTTHLEKSYRTDCESILENISNIKNKIGVFIEDDKSRFFLSKNIKVADILKELDVVNKRQFKILSPVKEYIPELNKIAREHFLGIPEHITLDWYLGSIVIITKNFYGVLYNERKVDLLNGEEGEIVGRKGNFLLVDFGPGKECVEFIITKERPKNDEETDDISMIGRSLDDPFPIKLESTKILTTYYLKESFAITVHSAQGSEWDHVMFYAPRITYNLSRKLFYTGASRAKKRLTVVSIPNFLRNIIYKETSPRYEYIGIRLGAYHNILQISEPELCTKCDELYEGSCFKCKESLLEKKCDKCTNFFIPSTNWHKTCRSCYKK
jgi:hypothetical protein